MPLSVRFKSAPCLMKNSPIADLAKYKSIKILNDYRISDSQFTIQYIFNSLQCSLETINGVFPLESCAFTFAPCTINKSAIFIIFSLASEVNKFQQNLSYQETQKKISKTSDWSPSFPAIICNNVTFCFLRLEKV